MHLSNNEKKVEQDLPLEFANMRENLATRIFVGCWQLAGGHGAVGRTAAIEQICAAYAAGIRTFDCADIYTGVEELLGAALKTISDTIGSEAAKEVRIHTKCVPDLDRLGTTLGPELRQITERSIARLGVNRLSLVQFHWWDLARPGALEALQELDLLRRHGLIENIGVTNFGAGMLETFVNAGLRIYSTQNQYSVIDSRPEQRLLPLCREHGVNFYCYGALAGGFLTDRYLGAIEPAEPLENRSLTKYKLIIDDIGGWDLFQEILRTLRRVADRHDSAIADIAVSYILDQPGVSAAILGQRNAEHLTSLRRITEIRLSAEDRRSIQAVLAQRQSLPGDVYDLERDRSGAHGRIMRYNLNSPAEQ